MTSHNNSTSSVSSVSSVVSSAAILKVFHADHGVSEALLSETLSSVDIPVSGEVFKRTFTVRETLQNGLYGPACGDEPVENWEVEMRRRSADRPMSRMIARKPRETNLLTVIGVKTPEGYVIFTAYGGPLAEREPGDPSLSAEEKVLAESFWAVHALAAL